MTASGLVQLAATSTASKASRPSPTTCRAVIAKEFPQHLYKVAAKRPIG